MSETGYVPYNSWLNVNDHYRGSLDFGKSVFSFRSLVSVGLGFFLHWTFSVVILMLAKHPAGLLKSSRASACVNHNA